MAAAVRASMNFGGWWVALGIYRDVTLAALDFLAGVVTALPPFRAVFAVCESTHLGAIAAPVNPNRKGLLRATVMDDPGLAVRCSSRSHVTLIGLFC
jgi:hypothetical protein